MYNTAVGDRTTVLDLFNSLKKHLGSVLEPEFIPTRQGDVRDSLADISKAQNLLDYDPKVRIDEGLEITLDWFKNNLEFIKDRS